MAQHPKPIGLTFSSERPSVRWNVVVVVFMVVILSLFCHSERSDTCTWRKCR